MTKEYSPLTTLLMAPPWRDIHGGRNTPLLVDVIIHKKEYIKRLRMIRLRRTRSERVRVSDGTPLAERAGRAEENKSPFSKGGFRGITRVYLVVSLLPTQAGWSGCSSLPVYKYMAFRRLRGA